MAAPSKKVLSEFVNNYRKPGNFDYRTYINTHGFDPFNGTTIRDYFQGLLKQLPEYKDEFNQVPYLSNKLNPEDSSKIVRLFNRVDFSLAANRKLAEVIQSPESPGTSEEPPQEPTQAPPPPPPQAVKPADKTEKIQKKPLEKKAEKKETEAEEVIEEPKTVKVERVELTPPPPRIPVSSNKPLISRTRIPGVSFSRSGRGFNIGGGRPSLPRNTTVSSGGSPTRRGPFRSVFGGLGNALGDGGERLLNNLTGNKGGRGLGRRGLGRKNLAKTLAKRSVIIWLLIFIIGVGVISVLIPSFFNPSGEKIEGLKNIPTCDKEVQNSTQINCQILVEYTATDSASIEITNTFSSNAKYASGSATDNATVDETFNIIKWQFKNLTTKTSKILKFALLPQTENDWVQNTVSVARINPLAATDSATITPPNTTSPVDKDALKGVTDFDILMTGQGRNVSVFGGGEDDFIINLQTNLKGTARESLLSDEARLRQIYKVAVAKRVNPLVVLTTWGTEASFDKKYDNVAFGCDPPRPDGSGNGFPGFDNQLSCGTNTWGNHMTVFESQTPPVILQSRIGKECSYTDALIYAAEKYGPVCTINDDNEHHRQNFVNIYKMLLGVR